MAHSQWKIWEYIKRRKFITMGIPFVIFVTGSSFFMKEFASIRYEFRKNRTLSNKEAEAFGLKPVNIETIQKEMLKEIEKADVDNWVNIRGPRPWEDSKTVQSEQWDKLKKGQSETKDGNL